MKKDYCKPTMNVVKIQHKCQILTGSNPTSVQTGLGNGDDFTIEDTPAGDGFWGHPCRRRLLGPLSTKRFREEAAAWRRPQRYLHAATAPHTTHPPPGSTPCGGTKTK